MGTYLGTYRIVSSIRSYVPASTARQSAYAEDWNAIHAPSTMEELRQEIDFYELRAREVQESDSPEEGWKYHLYRETTPLTAVSSWRLYAMAVRRLGSTIQTDLSCVTER